MMRHITVKVTGSLGCLWVFVKGGDLEKGLEELLVTGREQRQSAKTEGKKKKSWGRN